MICPSCNYDNLPGSEQCARCQQDLTQLDQPMAQDRVQRSLMEDAVSILRPRKPIVTRPETTVAEAIRIMLANNIGALLVVDADEKLVGVFTERDLLSRVAGESGANVRPIRDFMTPNPEAVVATDNLAFVLHKMDIGGYRHVPVTQGGKAVGVISVRDMLAHFTRLCQS